jgi:hypothetical protein
MYQACQSSYLWQTEQEGTRSMIELPEASIIASQMSNVLRRKVIDSAQLKNCD